MYSWVRNQMIGRNYGNGNYLDKTIGPQPGSMAANCTMCFTRLALLLLYLALQHYVIGHILFDLPSPAPKLLPT